jgi:riboflavin kinase/FMN adenylyltransferase
LLPADGVYATKAYIGKSGYPALTNIGVRPTFGCGRRIVEVHILDFEGNLYGCELIIDIIEKLRGEVYFKTTAELKKQIISDIRKGRSILKRQGGE